MAIFPPPGTPPPTPPPTPKYSSQKIKSVQTDFSEAQAPLEPTLTLPNEYIDFVRARDDYLSLEKVLQVPEKVEIPENKKRFQAIQKTAAQIAEFARGQPGTFALLLVGLAGLLLAITVLGLSFAGIGAITLGPAVIPLGLIFSVIMCYYGWTFVNMAKSHSIDAEYNKFLEAWGREQKKLTSPPLKQERVVVIEAGQNVIDAFHARYERQRKEAENALAEAQQTRNNRLEERKQLDRLLVSKGLLQEGKSIFFATSQEAIGGAYQVLLTMPRQILVEEEITLPPTPSALENAQKKENILAKFKQFVLDHPLATTLLIVGLVTLVLAIPVSIFFFEGLTAITIIGSLSAILIPQLIIYGLSFLYEAKNSLNIDERKKRLEHMKTIREILHDFHAKRRELTDRIDKDIMAYGRWIAQEEKKAADRHISAISEKGREEGLLKGLREGVEKMLLIITPEIPSANYMSSLVQATEEIFEGATTIGNEVVKRAEFP